MAGKYAQSVIYKRHSVRDYLDGPIGEEALDHILRSAMSAPSAHNTQPWVFLVVDDRRLLDSIPAIHPYAGMMTKAACAVLVCVKREVLPADPFYQQDIGASIENMLIAATEAGIGSCWCGIHPDREREERFAELFSIPQKYFAFAIVALGRMPGEPQPSDRHDGGRIFKNTFAPR